MPKGQHHTTDESVKACGFRFGQFWMMDRSRRVLGAPQIAGDRVGLESGRGLPLVRAGFWACESVVASRRSLATGCQLELRFGVGVVDPRAKRRFRD
jgi:hypothetical protein